MSSETSSPPTITDAIHVNNHALLNINMVNVTKLTAMNYLMWKLQVHALVDGYGLASHLDGSTVIPSTTVTISDVVSQNPEFVLWHRQDKLIYSSLLGSISLNVQSTLSQTTTAAEIWSTLADTCGESQSLKKNFCKLQTNTQTRIRMKNRITKNFCEMRTEHQT